ncbi:MAG: hypothetical protein EAZ20_08780 [Bacteroidetes bacterium]|nr:MAG: hypothetical protein EAZ20_08780 [Bacteroidota bacterium]
MYLDDKTPCIVKEWKGFTPAQEFKNILKSLVGLILDKKKEYKNLKVVADSRHLGVLSFDTLSWLSTEIYPHYLANGIMKKAFVESENVFGNYSITEYIKESNQKGDIEMRIFKTLQEAKNWLASA